MYEEKNIVHFMTHQLLILHTCTVFSSTLLSYISDVFVSQNKPATVQSD